MLSTPPRASSRRRSRAARGLSTAEQLILLGQLNGLQTQRLSIVDQLTTNQQQLALAEDVEAPQVITRGVATKTTARSGRNTVLVSALIGLILGGIAALLFDPVRRVVRRARSVQRCSTGSGSRSSCPRTTRRS